jgi:hypothetical protein
MNIGSVADGPRLHTVKDECWHAGGARSTRAQAIPEFFSPSFFHPGKICFCSRGFGINYLSLVGHHILVTFVGPAALHCVGFRFALVELKAPISVLCLS